MVEFVRSEDGIDVMIERMERKTDELEVWLTNHQRIWRKNRRFFFPTFVFGIKKV